MHFNKSAKPEHLHFITCRVRVVSSLGQLSVCGGWVCVERGNVCYAALNGTIPQMSTACVSIQICACAIQYSPGILRYKYIVDCFMLTPILSLILMNFYLMNKFKTVQSSYTLIFNSYLQYYFHHKNKLFKHILFNTLIFSTTFLFKTRCFWGENQMLRITNLASL